ncbi:MAG TPA: pentapeptide repeat-containing protein [Candidatus Baltobacteraceae bacterium]
MNAIIAMLEPIARAVVATLFNSLWESTLLAIAVWAVLRFVPNLNAATRYAAWCVAIAAAIVLPLATTLPRISLQHNVAYERVRLTSAHAVRPSAATLRTTHARVASPAVDSKAAPSPSGFRFPDRLRVAVPSLAALVIFSAWLLVALAILGRLLLNLVRLEKLKRDALPLPVDYREHLKQWEGAAKGVRDVRLCVSDKIEVPIAVGLFDSMVLIPQHLLEALSRSEIDQITLHELGHLRRGDDWTNAFQRVVQALFFFNPAILWIAQQLDLEREVACDDWVLTTTREVRPYAFCLTKMAEATTWPHRPMAAPGVFVTRKSLSIRVERLLRGGRNVRTCIDFAPTGLVAAALIVLFFGLQTVAPSIAFTLPQESIAAPPVVARPAPVATRVRHEVRIVKVQTRTVTIPARHIHLPARDIHVHIPPIHIDSPEQRFVVPDRAALRAQIQDSMRLPMLKMQGVFGHMPRLTGAGCTGCDMSGANLAGHNFRNKNYLGTNFKRANLQNADFRGASLTGVDFSDANLRGADLRGATMEGCNLRGADLTGANLEGTQMTGCDIDISRLVPAQSRAVLRGCMGCDFKNADLRGQDLRNVSLEGDDLQDADLRGADLSGAQFTGVDLHGARLDGARLSGTTFTGCDFSGVDLHNVDLSHTRIVGSKLRDLGTP